MIALRAAAAAVPGAAHLPRVRPPSAIRFSAIRWRLTVYGVCAPLALKANSENRQVADGVPVDVAVAVVFITRRIGRAAAKARLKRLAH